jgi:DNA sulfur modification protein DndD
MILESIRLENFGAYGGIQEADLAPRKGKPVVLFGGMNGGGKTTLLDALQLVLYGPKARVSNRGRLAYREYLQDCIHRSADPAEGAGITLRFRRIIEGQPRSFTLQRTWRAGAKGVEESLRVLRDGEPDALFTEHWDEVIESYLPVAISNLFFFDGEQIKELAEGDSSSAILGTAIQSLLGLDLVDRLENDLRVFERRKKAEALDEETLRAYRQVRGELEQIDGEQERLAMEEGRLVNEAGRLVKRFQDAEGAFRKEGGDLFLRRKELVANLTALETHKAEREDQLRDLAAGPLPLTLVEDLLEQVELQARKEVGIRHNRLLLEVMEARDQRLLEVLGGEKLAKTALRRVEHLLRDDRRERESAAAEPIILGADEHLPAQIAHLRASVLPNAKRQARELVTEIRALEEQIARARDELDRVPDEERIAAVHAELESARTAHVEKLAELQSIQVRREVLKRQRQETEARLERFGDKAVDAEVAEDGRLRMLKHSARVRETLGKFRSAVVARHVANMESLILDSFRQLLRKTDLVHGLSIDPETFRVSLSGRGGQPLPFDRLSAGERQLLATALLWGLARASGRPVPTIIDTPLGRLDSSHRQHLVQRYFPNASHQVILLSTDEEIVGRYYDALRPFVAREFELQHDEALRRTQIQPGYFTLQTA